jgi:hypothetical protein
LLAHHAGATGSASQHFRASAFLVIGVGMPMRKNAGTLWCIHVCELQLSYTQMQARGAVAVHRCVRIPVL